MGLDFDLELVQRHPDRVIVSVRIAPRAADILVEGVSLALVCPAGEPLSHRVVLPIAGRFSQAMRSHYEVRAREPLPPGAKVVGLAWSQQAQWEALIPADPGTDLRAHVLGSRLLDVPDLHDAPIRSATCSERARLNAVLPWLEPCAKPPVAVVDEEQPELDYLSEELGLDEESADWLRDLLKD